MKYVKWNWKYDIPMTMKLKMAIMRRKFQIMKIIWPQHMLFLFVFFTYDLDEISSFDFDNDIEDNSVTVLAIMR